MKALSLHSINEYAFTYQEKPKNQVLSIIFGFDGPGHTMFPWYRPTIHVPSFPDCRVSRSQFPVLDRYYADTNPLQVIPSYWFAITGMLFALPESVSGIQFGLWNWQKRI